MWGTRHNQERSNSNLCGNHPADVDHRRHPESRRSAMQKISSRMDRELRNSLVHFYFAGK
jgi:hypothetical protein